MTQNGRYVIKPNETKWTESRYHIHFLINTLEKGMFSFISQATG